MENEFDKTKPFDMKGYVDYLNKASVCMGCQVLIIDIKLSQNKYRPVFYGKFPQGTLKFDLCTLEMKKILDKYGNIPMDWVGKTLYIKANPYKDGKKEGLRLYINPL